MIVVACIAALSVLAIPNLMRARLNANEAVAQGTLKSISSACENFRLSQTPMAFPGTLQAMTVAIPAYLDTTVDTATSGVPKNGYNFTYTYVNDYQYVCVATPSAYNVTGKRTFAINETGLLRSADNAGAVVATEAEYAAMPVVQ